MTAKDGMKRWYDFLRKINKCPWQVTLNDIMKWEKDVEPKRKRLIRV